MSLKATDLKTATENFPAPFPDRTHSVRFFQAGGADALVVRVRAPRPLTSLANDDVRWVRVWVSNAFSSATVRTSPDTDILFLDSSTAHVKYKSRIAQLQSFAEEDGVIVNAASRREFLEFALSDPSIRQASLVLLDNGNLRAAWKTNEEGISIQFFGNGAVQMLISRQGDNGKLAHEAQRTPVFGLREAIEDTGLGHLLRE